MIIQVSFRGDIIKRVRDATKEQELFVFKSNSSLKSMKSKGQWDRVKDSIGYRDVEFENEWLLCCSKYINNLICILTLYFLHVFFLIRNNYRVLWVS